MYRPICICKMIEKEIALDNQILYRYYLSTFFVKDAHFMHIALNILSNKADLFVKDEEYELPLPVSMRQNKRVLKPEWVRK